MDKTQITLEIVFSEDEVHPSFWNWPELLDMPDRKHARVIGVDGEYLDGYLEELTNGTDDGGT